MGPPAIARNFSRENLAGCPARGCVHDAIPPPNAARVGSRRAPRARSPRRKVALAARASPRDLAGVCERFQVAADAALGYENRETAFTVRAVFASARLARGRSSSRTTSTAPVSPFEPRTASPYSPEDLLRAMRDRLADDLTPEGRARLVAPRCAHSQPRHQAKTGWLSEAMGARWAISARWCCPRICALIRCRRPEAASSSRSSADCVSRSRRCLTHSPRYRKLWTFRGHASATTTWVMTKTPIYLLVPSPVRLTRRSMCITLEEEPAGDCLGSWFRSTGCGGRTGPVKL